MASAYLHPARLDAYVYLAPLSPPVVVAPAQPTGPRICETTMMRLTTINVSAKLGPAAINLTANLP